MSYNDDLDLEGGLGADSDLGSEEYSEEEKFRKEFSGEDEEEEI